MHYWATHALRSLGSTRYLCYKVRFVAAAATAAVFTVATATLAHPIAAQTPNPQIQLHGRVIDAGTRAPLEDAELVIEGTNQHTHSGTDGTWQLPALSKGSYSIRVRRIGYTSTRIDITAPSDAGTPISIALTPSRQALDAVVVTASRRAERMQDAPVMMQLIDRHDIEQSGASDLSRVLTEQTGIQFAGGHPSGSGVGLEGMSDQQVLILLDGAPLYGRIADGLDMTRVPASAVERIEVVKGPQSTLYGSEAMGGVVNIITRRPLADAPPNLDAGVTVGSDNRIDLNLYGTAQLGPFATAANIGARHVERTAGIAGRAGALTRRRDGMGSVRWTPDASLAFDASALLVSERQRWASGGAFDFADNTQTNLKLGATHIGASSRLTSTISLSQLNHLSRAGQTTEPIAGTGDRQIQRLAQGDVLYSHATSSAVFDLGSEIRQEYIMSTDGRIAGGPRTIMSAEPYAQVEWNLGRWSVVPGARLAWSEQYGTYLSPRVATRFRVDSSLTLRASIGRGFRAPDFKELYLDFTNDAAFYAVHGNPNLRPEHADNISAGAEWTGRRSYARTLLYWNELRDFIETQPLPNAGQIAQFTYGNIARSRTRGVESEAGVTVGIVHADVGYAYLATRDASTAGPLLGQPAHSGRLRVTAPMPLGIEASAIDVYTGRTPMQRAGDGSISSSRGAYNRIDLHLLRRAFGRTDLSIGIDNVFDTRPALWADPVARQVYAGITWHTSAR